MGLAPHEKKDLGIIAGISAFIAGLCCFAPVVLALLGLGLGLLGISFAPGEAAFASNLAAILYGQYKWLFRSAGLLALLVGLVLSFRRRGICTLDDAKRSRTKIINLTLLALLSGIVLYLFWLYVVVEWLGIGLGLWG